MQHVVIYLVLGGSYLEAARYYHPLGLSYVANESLAEENLQIGRLEVSKPVVVIILQSYSDVRITRTNQQLDVTHTYDIR